MPEWSHTRCWSSIMDINRLSEIGNFPQALKNAQELLNKCLQEGEEAYSEAAYDLAYIHLELGQVLKKRGTSQAALGNRDAAQESRDRDLELYLAYRRDSGENRDPGGKLCTDFRQALKNNQREAMKNRLDPLGENREVWMS